MLFRSLLLAPFLAVASRAQEPPPRATASIGRVAEADAPRIDGHLEDPCWANAPAIGELTMVEPWEGRAPTQRTVVRLLHDRQDTWAGGTQKEGFAVQPFGFTLHTGDQLVCYVQLDFERVETDFALFRSSTVVAAGDYWVTRGGLSITTSEGRVWNGTLLLDSGDFFDGSMDQLQAEATWRLSPLLHMGGGYDTADVDLGPGRAFTTHIASGRLDLFFTSVLILRNLVQFDNESNELGWQSRLRWIHAPGCDFFAVLGTTWLHEDDGSLAPTEQTLQLKLSHTLRF